MMDTSEMVRQALAQLQEGGDRFNPRQTLSFADYLQQVATRPTVLVRNVFQVFHDMIKTHVGEGIDEYPGDTESIHFLSYDCRRLFVEGSDQPFFADRLFANRLLNLVEALKRGAQQNKIYIFEGPHGSGKSTFLNNLLRKFEEYANTADGVRYETLWRLQRSSFGEGRDEQAGTVLERLAQLLGDAEGLRQELARAGEGGGEEVEIPCPCHDNPLLLIPRRQRHDFYRQLLPEGEFRARLFSHKEYDWVFREEPCTICASLFQALLDRLQHPRAVYQAVHARPYRFNRRLGEGISVFNPGDKPLKESVLGNPLLQRRLNVLLKDSNLVRYIFSRHAKINQGIYALMDIKAHNVERLMELHNVISEGVHKVEDLEEQVSSLFLALMNPEDRATIENFPSFSDRIEAVKISYVLDVDTEVEIYRNVFGRQIDDSFLPRVLQNFARIIISTRLNLHSEALMEWIVDPDQYRLYCDANLQLLKMEIYAGNLPKWLDERDRKGLTAQRRRKLIAESEGEGDRGFSGRDAIRIFNDFYSAYARQDRLINMAVLKNYFSNVHRDLGEMVPHGFIDSLQRLYDYTILQEVKESLYYYNEARISRDIQNYLFAVNFELGSAEVCTFTGEKLEISEEFLQAIETRLLGGDSLIQQRLVFRRATQKEYTAKTLTQEIMAEGKQITETALFLEMHERYVHNLKEGVLEPFLRNDNFRRAIKDYGQREAFKAYDKRIRDDVTFLMNNLCRNFSYTRQGAKEVCIYVIDNDLAIKFSHA
jgi:predicted Ser/Thr protein kinase